MIEVEEKIHELALQEGLTDQEARKIARDFGQRIREHKEVDPPPKVLIQQKGENYLVFLKNKNEELAREFLDDQELRGSYTLDSIKEKSDRYCHTFIPSKKEKESSSEDSIEEMFENLPHEEQKDALKSLEKMAQGG